MLGYAANQSLWWWWWRRAAVVLHPSQPYPCFEEHVGGRKVKSRHKERLLAYFIVSFKAGVWEGEGDVETRECWWRRKGAEQRPPRRIARSSSSQPAPATPLRCSVSSKSRFSIWIKGRSETLPFDRSNRLAPLNACSETLQLAKPSSWSSSLIADYNRWRRWQNPLLDYLLFSQYLKLMHTLLNIFTPFTPLYHWNPWKFHVSDKWLINLASFHCAYQQ